MDIPLDNVLALEPSLLEAVYSSTSTSTERADDEGLDLAVPASLAVRLDLGADDLHEGLLVRVALLRAEALALGLLSEGEAARGKGDVRRWLYAAVAPAYSQSKGSSCEAGVPTKGSHTPAIGVLEELKIVELAATLLEAREDVDPPTLLLVAVSELDVSVRKRWARRGELLEAKDWDVRRQVWP